MSAQRRVMHLLVRRALRSDDGRGPTESAEQSIALWESQSVTDWCLTSSLNLHQLLFSLFKILNWVKSVVLSWPVIIQKSAFWGVLVGDQGS